MRHHYLTCIYLLAALIQPVMAQNRPATKSAPDLPVMPYRVATALTGSNHGTVVLTATPPEQGSTRFAPLEDSKAYNTATVKVALTPEKGYAVRALFPKAYKTSDTTVVVALTALPGTADSWTLLMPAHPVTIQMAYAELLQSIAADTTTLKERMSSADEIIRTLPAKLAITFATGRKDSLAVVAGSWQLKEGTAFRDGDGLSNTFTCLLSALPDSLSANGLALHGSLKVINKPAPLEPEEEDEVVISGDGDGGLNAGGGSGSDSDKTFNGIIGKDDSQTTVKGIEVGGDVTDATITLKEVTVSGTPGETPPATTVKPGADVTLRLEGENNLGTLANEGTVNLVLPDNQADLGSTTISNSGSMTLTGNRDKPLPPTVRIENEGIFTDSIGLVSKVEGSAALDINGQLRGGGVVETGAPITLLANTNDNVGTITFSWQKQAADGSFADIEGASTTYQDGVIQSATPTRATTTATAIANEYYVMAAQPGDAAGYRCQIKRVAVDTGAPDKTVSTSLTTGVARIEVKTPDTDPDPDPNPPTDNATIETGIRVWAADGRVCVRTDSPEDVFIYNFGGQLCKVMPAVLGDASTQLSTGNYVVVIGKRSYKVQMSR